MTNHPNRRRVLGAMFALHALAFARIPPAQAQVGSRTEPIPVEDFMALSQRLTGHTALSPTLGGRILAVLTEHGQSAALQSLYGAAPEPAQDVTVGQSAVLRMLFQGWYLGRIEIADRTHLTGFEQVLMGRVTADILPLRSYCGGTMGFWIMPPDVGALPLRGVRL
jgi:fructose 5-dehydrogenase small subunit